MDIKYRNPITGELDKIVLDNMIKIKTNPDEVIPNDTLTVYDLPNKNLQVLANGELVKFTNAYTDEDKEKVETLPELVQQITESNKSYTDNQIEGLESTIPTKTSELQNDSGYITTDKTLTEINSQSTNETLPTSKAVYDFVNSQQTIFITDTENSVVTAFELENNTEYRFMLELESIEFTLPANSTDDYISSLVFKSGATATTITYPDTIKWAGDNISSDKFVPTSSKTYEVLIYWNGIDYCGIVKRW